MESILILNERLKKIESEIDALKLNYNYNNGFKNKIDLQQFISDNKTILEEANILRKQVKTIKWELMTPDEKAHKIENIRKVLTKTSSKSQEEILEVIRMTIEKDGGL